MPYLDYNSTTPVDDRVIQAMLPTFAESFGKTSDKTIWGLIYISTQQ